MDLIRSVDLQKLLDICSPIHSPPWGFGKPIKEHEVQSAIDSGDLLATPHSEFSRWSRKQHIQRIAYFCVNGWNEPIELDVGIPVLGYVVDWPILDGNHRVCAAAHKRDNRIMASVGGQIDYAEATLGFVA